MKLSFRKPPRVPERRRVTTTTRPQVFSYHTRRSAELGATGRQLFREVISPERAKRATRFWLKRVELLVLVIAVTAGLVNILLLSSDPRILPANPSETSFLRDKGIYHQAAEKLLAASALNHNKLTVDVNAVSVSMRRQFPELDVVSIALPLMGHKPIVYIASTHPVLLLTTSYGRSYVIDENGRALAHANDISQTANLAHVKDDGGAPVYIGHLTISKDTVTFIQTILFQLRAKQLDVSTFTLPAGRSELDAAIAGQGYFVKFNLAEPSPLAQAGTFLAARQKLQERGITPSHYIDVRLAGRAYYQ